MPRADELISGDRIRHPDTRQVVEVVRVSNGLSATKVYFKAHGTHGRFNVAPHAEMEEM